MATPEYCHCCGTQIFGSIRDIHTDCWIEHHSDPTGPWPGNHRCKFDVEES